VNTTSKVAVVTGASQGIGTGLSGARLRAVANARSIRPDALLEVLAIARNITDP
jgi:NAD(P)-dependent dehydrogenase (short-subunit alcohol dehydrogenase family)